MSSHFPHTGCSLGMGISSRSRRRFIVAPVPLWAWGIRSALRHLNNV